MNFGAIAAANAIAGGLNGYIRGLEYNDAKNRRDTEDAWNKEQRGRMREQWARDDSLRADTEGADKAAADVLRARMGGQPAQAAPGLSPVADNMLGQPQPQMSLDPSQAAPSALSGTQPVAPASLAAALPAYHGAPGSSMAPAALGGPPANSPAVSPVQGNGGPPAVAPAMSVPGGVGAGPSPAAGGTGAIVATPGGPKGTMQSKVTPDEHLLPALEARANYFMQKGRIAQFKDAWTSAAEVRSTLRAKAFQSADLEYRQTGDPLVYAQKVYPLINDGQTYLGGQTVTGADGKPAISMKVAGPDGAEREINMPVDKFMGVVNYARDPQAVLAAEAAHAKKTFETNEEMRRDAAKEDATGKRELAVEGVRQTGREKIEGIKTAGNLKEIGARGAQDRTTKAYEIENTPRTLSEGQELKVAHKNKDGSISYITAADNKRKDKEATPTRDRDLSDIAIQNFGDKDPVAGRNIGNSNTARISAAARDIMKANPGLDANRAIFEAAKTLGFVKDGK